MTHLNFAGFQPTAPREVRGIDQPLGMNPGRTVFAQLMEGIHREEFRRCVERYGGDRRVRRFSCRDQFLAMAFAQMTYRESLRDIEACLRSRRELLYHLGFRGVVARSTLAEANERRDWRIYADLAQKLILKARRLYAEEELGVELAQTIYAFDSTTIDQSRCASTSRSPFSRRS